MLVSNALPATATRTAWSFAYLPNVDPAAAGDGTLTVVEEQGKRVKRTVVSRYTVEEQPARGCRCFLVCVAGRSGDEDTAAGRAALARVGEVYRTAVGPRPSCTCPGFAAGGRPCKHVIALTELVAVGDLPSPLCDPADFADNERQPAA